MHFIRISDISQLNYYCNYVGWLQLIHPRTIFLFLPWEQCIRDRCKPHYSDVIMSAMVSQITSLAIVYSTVYSDTDQRNHQSTASLAFVRGSHRWPVNSLHKWPVTRKIFPFDDVTIVVREWGHGWTTVSLTYWGSIFHWLPLYIAQVFPIRLPLIWFYPEIAIHTQYVELSYSTDVVCTLSHNTVYWMNISNYCWSQVWKPLNL